MIINGYKNVQQITENDNLNTHKTFRNLTFYMQLQIQHNTIITCFKNILSAQTLLTNTCTLKNVCFYNIYIVDNLKIQIFWGMQEKS